MKKFGMVSKSIMAHTSLSAEAKAVYSLLSCYCNTERVCFPSTATLARLLGKSEATIYRLLGELEKNGIIRKARQGRKRIIIIKDDENKMECRIGQAALKTA